MGAATGVTAQDQPEGIITVLFTDIVGSAALKTAQGDAAAQDLVRAHFDLLRQQIDTHRGREIKTLGDGLMATFVSPRNAVSCAIGMQRALADGNRARPDDQRLQLRVGLNSGEAIREDGDLFGSTVDAAARICAKAAGGQILTSETVRGVVGATKDIQFADRGRFRLKGFPDRWRLVEVVWQEKAPAPRAPVLAERTPFVGREVERAELRRLLEQAIGGHGALVMIGGEPGVGKTRLCQELMAEARQRGMTAMIGHCYEVEGAPPYIPFVEILEAAARMFPLDALRNALGDHAPEVARLMPELRHVFPDIREPPQLPPEQERRYLFNGMREFIARSGRAQPLLLILDDLHWADDATMLLVQHVAQELHEMPVLVLATYRDVELNVARPLANALEQLVRQRLAQRHPLKRFSEAGVEAMLRALSGQEPPGPLVGAIYSETEGNPFFVEEVFKHLSEEGKLLDPEGRWRSDLHIDELDVPEGIRLVIGRRLERLSEEGRKILTAAAMIGRGFSFDLLSAISGAGEDALLDAVDGAERAHLIAAASEGPGEARFTFAHELIRQTLVSGVSLPRRQRLHLRVAEAIERVYEADLEPHAADLAYHHLHAGAAMEAQKTVRYLWLAGERAQAAGAFEEALRHYEKAIPLQPAGEPRGLAELWFKRGLARRSLGRSDEALADWRKALAVYEKLGDIEAVGRICSDIVIQLAWRARYVEALEISQRGLSALGEGASADRCRLLAVSGQVLSGAGSYAPADSMIAQAIAMAQELGDQGLLGYVLTWNSRHRMYYMQDHEVVETGLRAAELLRSEGNLWDLAEALAFTGHALVHLGRFEEATQICRELEPQVNRLGHPGALMMITATMAKHEVFTTGDLDRWVERGREGIQLCLEAGFPWVSHFRTCVGLGYFWRGRWEEAAKQFEEAAAQEPPGFMAGVDWSSLFLFRAYTQPALARSMLRQKRRRLPLLLDGLRRGGGLQGVKALRLLRASIGGRESHLALLRQQMGDLPKPGRANTFGAWIMMVGVVEGLLALGEQKEAARLYPVALQAGNGGAVVSWPNSRLFETVAGMAAAAGRQWEKAEKHYEAALRQAHELPIVIEQPEVRRWYGRMLIDRDWPGDRDKAFRLLTEAVAMYKKIGMPKHVEMAERMLHDV